MRMGTSCATPSPLKVGSRQGRRGCGALPEQLGRQPKEPPAQPVHSVKRVELAQPAQPVQSVKPAKPDLLAEPDLLGCKAMQASRDQQANKGLPGQLVALDLPGSRDRQAQQVGRDQQGQPVIRVQSDRPVIRGSQEPQ